MDLKEIIKGFSERKIVIVGDVMLDKYIYGNVDRISPEAPVPIVKVEKEVFELGGAANVAKNIVSLGGKVLLFGYIGDDRVGERLLKELDKRKISFHLPRLLKQTIQKTRIIGNNNQIARIDKENYINVQENFEDDLCQKILKENPEIIIVSDYGKGTITNTLISRLKNKGIKIIVDPKPKNKIDYSNVYLITPNLKEAIEITELNDVSEAGKSLQKSYLSNILITRGRDGMTLFEGGEEINFPTQAREVYDVSGAGDSVVAALGLCIASEMNLKDAVFLANTVAGIAVNKAGTASVFRSEVEQIIEKENSKIKTLEELRIIIEDLHRKNKKVAWTNGCFDILHMGHIDYLSKAKKTGDYLIVGLNSDNSVRRVKGEGRPINSEQNRAGVLSSLECVDYIVIFDEPSTENCLIKLKPDFYVKGGDYNINTINQPERKIVENYGGEIVLIPLTINTSTTKIIEKINK